MKRWNFNSFIKFWLWSCLGGLLAMQFGFIIHIASLNVLHPSTSNFMVNESMRLCHQIRCDNLQYQWVPYEQMSIRIKQAVVASEDANFNEHNGIEIKAILAAWAHNKNGHSKYGGSTITQQLAKNLYLSSEQSYLRKAQELAIAFYLETLLSKERIFEIYLNVVEWGEGIFGIEAASQYYFDIPAKKLKSWQAARLASALPAPKCFDKAEYCQNVHLNFNRRAKQILKRMVQASIPTEIESMNDIDALNGFLKQP